MEQDGRLPTCWLSSRKNSLLRRMEHLCAMAAAEHRRAQRRLRLQEVEEAMATGPRQPEMCFASEKALAPGGQSALALELELMTKRLEAANAELRRYETRLFAYERAMLDLRRENAELLALCQQAREGKPLPPKPEEPAQPVLEKPELPVIRFPAPAHDAGALQAEPSVEITTLLDTGIPVWEPHTKLEHLSVEIVRQLEHLMG